MERSWPSTSKPIAAGARCCPRIRLPSFANALSMGVDTLELDIGVTADGALVVSHERGLNPDLARDADGRLRRPARHSLRPPAACRGEEIRRRPDPPRQRLCRAISRPARRAGHADPDLEARCLRWCANPATAACASTSKPRSIRTIRTNPRTRSASSRCCSISSTRKNSTTASWCSRSTGARCSWCSKRAPAIPTVYLTLQKGKAPTVLLRQSLRMDRGLQSRRPRRLAAAHHQGGRRRDLVALFRRRHAGAGCGAHGLGLKVVVWTVNKQDDIARLIDIGVDGIISDRPDLLREVAGEKGIALPKGFPVTP